MLGVFFYAKNLKNRRKIKDKMQVMQKIKNVKNKMEQMRIILS